MDDKYKNNIERKEKRGRREEKIKISVVLNFSKLY